MLPLCVTRTGSEVKRKSSPEEVASMTNCAKVKAWAPATTVCATGVGETLMRTVPARTVMGCDETDDVGTALTTVPDTWPRMPVRFTDGVRLRVMTSPSMKDEPSVPFAVRVVRPVGKVRLVQATV